MTCPARTSYATPRVSPRSPNDRALSTLAVVRNGSLSRVGSVASVVATTSSIAIQVVLIHRVHHSRQWVAKIFFRALSGEMLRVRDLHHVSRPVEGPPTHRVRALREDLCAVCIARVEVKISTQWMAQQRTAHLN